MILLAGLLLAGSGSNAPGDRPVDVFAELDGTWRGTFVGYDPSGRELYRIRVEQTYETTDAHTQRVRIRDTDLATGETVTGEGKNVARRTPDGELELSCVVEKSNGERVEHRGRLVEGAGGAQQIIWYSNDEDRAETFRETVRERDGGDVYTIDGMGRYGDTRILMHGRYGRVTE
jgi:hypothetical protein